MTLPNFLIIGAPKCGTTSAYAYLRSHPEVFMPQPKEPYFFSPMVWHSGVAITDVNDYMALFEGAEGIKAVGEASPSYLIDGDSPGLIHNLLGDKVKLIAFLRNPVQAAYSLWAFNVMMAREPLTFREALAAEKERLAALAAEKERRNKEAMAKERYAQRAKTRHHYGFTPKGYPYVEMYTYAPQFKRYFETFGAENVKVFIFEEFFAPGLSQYRDLCRFLGISDDHVPDGKVHLRGRWYSNKWLYHLATERMAWKEPLKSALPIGFRLRLRGWLKMLTSKEGSMPALDDDLRQALQQEFQSDVREVERLLSKDLSHLWF